MSDEKKKLIEEILEETRGLAPKGRDFVAGYIFGRNEECEEQKKRHAEKQTA